MKVCGRTTYRVDTAVVAIAEETLAISAGLGREDGGEEDETGCDTDHFDGA